jgi:hypothetical protein
MSTGKIEPARNPSLREQADRYIDEHHHNFQKLAPDLSRVFPLREGNISAQVRNLQQITVSATRFADIEDFIKNQMGKEASKPGEKRWGAVGESLLRQLAELRKEKALEPGGAGEQEASPENQLRFRLMLARGWVRAVVSEYLYQAATSTVGRPES